MRAIVCTRYGPPDVLRLREAPKPFPKDGEVLVRIRATTAGTADCELRRFDFAPWIWLPMRLGFGIRRPRRPVLGQELAGDVEAVGKDVRSFAKGDRVFAATGIGLGAYAEYICLRENPPTGAIATMPETLGYEVAATVPYGGGEALTFLRKGKVRSGQRVLVNGAGGSFGTFAVQLAKVLGAHVTAVDSVPKLEMLRAIGADRVIDYSQEDFTGGFETWDVIFDVVRGTPSGRMVRARGSDARWSRPVSTPCGPGELAGVSSLEIRPSTAGSGSGRLRASPGTACRRRTCSASCCPVRCRPARWPITERS
jgi:NADPH:quinone reductase-like Zn-dependent oxidoreductase